MPPSDVVDTASEVYNDGHHLLTQGADEYNVNTVRRGWDWLRLK